MAQSAYLPLVSDIALQLSGAVELHSAISNYVSRLERVPFSAREILEDLKSLKAVLGRLDDIQVIIETENSDSNGSSSGPSIENTEYFSSVIGDLRSAFLIDPTPSSISKITSWPFSEAQTKRMSEVLRSQTDLLFEKSRAKIEPLDKYQHEDNKGNSSLHYAAVFGQENYVKLILESGADVNTKSVTQETPLHFAASQGSARIVEMLLKHGAEIEATSAADKENPAFSTEEIGPLGTICLEFCAPGSTALHQAATYGHEDVVELLLNHGANLNAKTSLSQTPLMLAASSVQHQRFRGDKLPSDVRTKVGTAVTSLLLRKGANVHATAEDGMQAIHFAASSGSLEILKLLLEAGSEVDSRTEEGRTALQLACKERDLEAAKLLIEHGADINAADDMDQFVSHYAAQYGSLEILRLLLEKNCDFDAEDQRGRTPLMMATWTGDSEIVQLLLDRGADIEYQNRRHETALSHAVMSKSRLPAVSTLLKAGAKVDVPDVFGSQACHWSALSGNVEALELLLDGGADIEARDQRQDSSLILAAGEGRLDIIKTLVRRKADLDYCPENGKSALMEAAALGHVGVIKLLLESGADVEMKSVRGLPVIHFALKEGMMAAFRILRRHMSSTGKSLDVGDEQGDAPLHIAAWYGYLDGIEDLVDAGAQINLKNDLGETPLYLAACRGHVKIVKFLVERGADVNAITNARELPLYGALSAKNDEIEKCLIEAGTEVETLGGKTLFERALNTESFRVIQTLIEKGLDPDGEYDCDWTPFHLAVVHNEEQFLRDSLEKGFDVNCKDRRGRTPLLEASGAGHKGLVSLFLEKGANLEDVDKDKRTPLHLACRGGYPEVVKVLMEKGAAHGSEDSIEATPLHYACMLKTSDIARILIEAGANVKAVDDRAWTPLHWAAGKGAIDTMKLLLEHGADINAPATDKWTPLALACKDQDEKAMLLMERGAEFRNPGVGNGTPLHWAATYGRKRLGRLLLEHEVNIDALDDEGLSALHIACQKHDIDFVRMLLDHGANMEVKKVGGNCPIHEALMYDNRAALVFIEKGVDISSRGQFERTPLHVAAICGLADIVTMLLEKGAEVDALDSYGNTPLLEATARYSGKKMVNLLLAHGANIKTVNSENMTALTTAIRRGSHQVARILIERGAPLEPPPTVALEDVPAIIVSRDDESDIEEQTPGRDTCPLRLLVIDAEKDLVKLLIEKGVDVNGSAANGRTALHLAASRDPKIVQMLLDAGADADVTDNDGWSALHHAALGGNEECVRIFLAKTIHPDAPRNKDGCPPSHFTTDKNSIGAMRLLLAAGADPDAACDRNNTPLITASKLGNSDFISLLLETKRPIDVNRRNKDGHSALYQAAAADVYRNDSTAYDKTVRILLDAGADPTPEGCPPLIRAADNGFENVVRMLLDAGASPTAPDERLCTPLMWASQFRHPRCVQMLLDTGKVAVSTHINNAAVDGDTALHCAALGGDVRVLKLLLALGKELLDIDLVNLKGMTARDMAVENKNEEFVALFDRWVKGEAGPDELVLSKSEWLDESRRRTRSISELADD